MKQLQPDAWESFFRSHQVGDVVRGRVCRAAAFRRVRGTGARRGSACATARRFPGLPGRHDESPLPIGEEMDFKIVRLNEAEKKIGLSVRALADDEERTGWTITSGRPRPPP